MAVEILDYSTYYDGPLAGRCLYEGEEHEYRCFNPGGWASEACCTPRIYQVFNKAGKLIGAFNENEL